MFWYIKSFRLAVILFSSFRGVYRLSLFRSWFFLEISLIAFIFWIRTYLYISQFQLIIKLFIVQSIGGLILLVFLLIKETTNQELVDTLIIAIILIKIGAIPFHWWAIKIVDILNWDTLTIFLTILKMIPLFLLQNTFSSLIIIIGLLSFIISSIRSIYSNNLKILIFWSSLFFLGILLIRLKGGASWPKLLIIYTIILLPLTKLFKEAKVIQPNPNNSNLIISVNVLSFFLLINLMGFPPFPGFFLKLLWLLESKQSFIGFFIFLSSNIIILFIYLSFSLKSFSQLVRRCVSVNSYRLGLKIFFLGALTLLLLSSFLIF